MSNGNGHPWSKFWWRDWLSDHKLRLCDAATRGIWMDLLCLMHEADGYLRINGSAAKNRNLARILQTSERQIERALQILLHNGVASVTDDGVIYCQRMVNDIKASETGREAADRRWNGSHPNGSPNRSPNGKPKREPNAKKLEAERKNTSLPGCDAAPKKVAASTSPSEVVEPDPRADLWREGIPLLQGMFGMMDRAARAFLGKLLSLANDDCSRILALLHEADRQRPIDAAAWLIANAKPFRNAGLAVIADEGFAIEGAAAMERLLAAEAKGHA